MAEVKVLIVEDELLIGEDLAFTLKQNNYNVVGVVPTGEQALKQIENEKPDIVIMDIGLSGEMDGIETTKKLNEQYDLPTIYLTSHEDIEVWRRAKETYPSAYIIKPFDDKEIQIAIELALHNMANGRREAPTDKNKGYLLDDRIFVKINHRYEKILLEDISFLKADGSYTEINTKNRKFTVSDNMNQFSKQLQFEQFLRVHRSWMINLKKIDAFEENRVVIDGVTIPIGKTYKEEFRKKFKYL